jgi:hypothetical protein
MFKKTLLGLGLSLSAVSLTSAAPVADNLLPKRPPIVAPEEARKDFTGTIKRLPSGKMVLETLTKTYDLDFASRSASRQAQKLVGMEVKVSATEQKGGLKVYSSSPLPAACRLVPRQ